MLLVKQKSSFHLDLPQSMNSTQQNPAQNSPDPEAIHVSANWETGQLSGKTFTSSFRIGRDPACDIHITDPVVSRQHAEVVLLAGKWWIQDSNSANGIFINGKAVARCEIKTKLDVRLGRDGPLLSLSIDQPILESSKTEPNALTEAHYQKHYFSDQDDGDAGEHTIMVRRAFAKVQKKQKRTYGVIIGLVVCLFLIAGSVAVYNHLQIVKQQKLAEEIFYTMKGLEIKFASVLEQARESEDSRTIAKVEQYKQQAKTLENSYTEFVDTLGVYNSISPEEQAILQTARAFGECELLVPPDFTKEVMRYIKKWQSSKRFVNALQRAASKGYITPIARTMIYYSLPPQFFYLAMQESNFNTEALGPKTRWGIAKGMWQFIPETGSRYGLQTGPLYKERKVDPQDDRHNFAKSTIAAAKYLRKIYDTDAQASGLLVMASYNWGENRVIRMVRAMPNNPQERNFWKFFKQYKNKMPKQTYDYVFYIFSAAVIGENPHLFGFNFDNPLLVAGR